MLKRFTLFIYFLFAVTASNFGAVTSAAILNTKSGVAYREIVPSLKLQRKLARSEQTNNAGTPDDKRRKMSKILRIVLIVWGICILLFVALAVVFLSSFKIHL